MDKYAFYVEKKTCVLKNVNEIEQNFANSKNVHEWKNILKIQKTVCDIQNSVFIHKMFADSKNDHAFQK